MGEVLYTVKEVSNILKTNTDYVYKLMNLGLLKYLTIGRRKVRSSTLDEFIKKYEGYDITDPENIQANSGKVVN